MLVYFMSDIWPGGMYRSDAYKDYNIDNMVEQVSKGESGA
jgi:hypothetical protein